MALTLALEDTDIPKFDKPKYSRHLRGWFSYAFASEVFVIVSLTLFLPICLEQFARDNGFLLPDKKYPCTPVTTQPVAREANQDARCVVKLGWVWIDSASFSLYVYSISVALQALTVISMGGIADHPPHRKKLLLTFAALGSLSAILFLLLPSSSAIWPVVALLAIVANVGFGASIVALNAYIPTLAQGAQEVRRTTPIGDAHDPLLGSGGGVDALVSEAKARHDKLLSATTSRISSQGIALGYAAGIGSTDSLRLAVGLSGLWWALFSLPAAGLASWRGAIVLEESEPDVIATRLREEEDWSISREIVRAWKRLGQMLKWREIKSLRNTFVYLAAWFLLSDGFTTITSTALLFAKTTLHMPASSLILIGALTPSAVFQKSNVKFGGLTTPGEMYVLAVYFGSVYGAFQGYARAFYAEFIPPGEEARWYGLFSITDKSSSFVGPLVVGLIADATGNIRYAFFFLVFMIWSADARRYTALGT
ncbi:MFS general substrate transporter [Ganoderma leucocontextum]|nr:MFS general substrate transporter [Ganoderma leucocontextum]